MSSTSEHKEAVWEFLKLFISDEFLVNHCETLFTIKNSMQDYAFELEKEWQASGGKLVYYIGNQEIQTNITDGVDIDLAKELLDTVTGVFKHNETLYNIVIEEASAYFAGAKTAQQAAEIIQGRAQIYINEKR